MTKTDDFDGLAQLLPFYVNGTLPLGERARIEAALGNSADLREQLAQVRQLSMLIKQGGEEIMAGANDTEDRLNQLSERLDDPVPDKEKPESGDTAPQLGDLLGYLNPARWHPGVALALALALLAQTVFILSRPNEHSFQTASGDEEQVQSNAVRLIVRLKPEAKWSDVEALLADQSLTIIAGPSEGRLTLRLDSPDADVRAVVERLRQSPSIAFADELK